MRHFKNKKDQIKYVIIDKTTKKVSIHRFKTKVASKIGVSTRTLDRNMPYCGEKYDVFMVDSVEI